MSKMHIMKSSTTGAAFRYARAQAKTLNVPYVQLWTGVLVLLLSVVLIMHPLNVWGYGWYNVFPFALTLIVVMFTGLMPFWLVLAALVGAGYQGSKWNNPFGGAATAVDFWTRKVVASALTAYAFLALPLIAFPVGNFPLAYYGYAIGVVVIFFAGLAYGKPMGFGYKVLVGFALATMAIGAFHAVPSSVKQWAEETIIGSTGSESTGSVGELTEQKTGVCKAVVKYYTITPGKTLTFEPMDGCDIRISRTSGPDMLLNINGGKWHKWTSTNSYGTNNKGIEKMTVKFPLGTSEGAEVKIRVRHIAKS